MIKVALSITYFLLFFHIALTESQTAPNFHSPAIPPNKNLAEQKLASGSAAHLPSVIFRLNGAELSSDARSRIEQIASSLRRTGQGRKILVEGHASQDESNQQELSESRARAVAEALASHGIERNWIAASGLGSRAPVASNQTEAGRSQNRRVEVIIEN